MYNKNVDASQLLEHVRWVPKSIVLLLNDNFMQINFIIGVIPSKMIGEFLRLSERDLWFILAYSMGVSSRAGILG